MDVNATLDIVNGLTATQKTLPSKLFYDEKGSELFKRITETPEYYLTECEKEILRKNADYILEQMHGRHFNLIELGAGDGSKASLLLSKAVTLPNFQKYIAVDISPKYLQEIEESLSASFPRLDIETIVGDYSDRLEEINFPEDQGNIFLFLGSSIGNFSPTEAALFLEKLSHKMKEGDLLIVGYDLKKAERIMYKAYNDAQGLTAAFNLNLLDRLNREFGANFILENFKHVEIYNPGISAMESYLMSNVTQKVYFEDLDFEVHFQKDEMIQTEHSYKYSVEEIEEMTKEISLNAMNFLFDHRRYFAAVIYMGRSLH